VSVAERLQIQIVTFNRAPKLDATLRRLSESPFADCPIRVLDNSSTDETPEVCERWRSRFADLLVIRHSRNIGGNANLLRAAELSRAPYTWILADDDFYDWSDCGDVTEALEAGEVDLISVGGSGRGGWPSGVTTMQALLGAGARLAFNVGFVPSTIFRTELYDSTAHSEGYRLVDSLYPHMAFYARQFERNAPILVSRSEVVIRDETGGVPVSTLYWLRGWVRSCRQFTDPRLRRHAVFDVAESRVSWWRYLAGGVVLERAYRPKELWPELLDLAEDLDGVDRLRVMAIGIVATALPGTLFRPLLRKVLRSVWHDDAPTEALPFATLGERS